MSLFVFSFGLLDIEVLININFEQKTKNPRTTTTKKLHCHSKFPHYNFAQGWRKVPNSGGLSLRPSPKKWEG